MTDEDAIEAALAAVDPRARDHVLVRRNGRDFIALPATQNGAVRTLNLYQPQRPKAVIAILGIRLLAATGLHSVFLPRFYGVGGQVAVEPGMPSCLPGTAGVMLGSPEHKVRRAILSYETSDGWEVAKVAFGPGGRSVINGEHAALARMPSGIPGIPTALGAHHGDELSILRLPYFRGAPLYPGSFAPALALLESWIRDLPERRVSEFSEWPAIASALETSAVGRGALVRLAKINLRPVIRHGDFARWNLLELADRKLMAIDWEWGDPAGMPAIDVVHYFLQDARLVRKRPPVQAIRETLDTLNRPECHSYLKQTGWDGDPLLPIIASLAWKQGAGHQENSEILGEILNFKF